MKHIYTLICLFALISFNASSQSDLIGTWYLDHIVKEGVTHPNYFNSYTVFSLEFTNNSGDLPGTLSFSSGHGCNASNGSYSVDTNEITINTSGTTLADCLTAPYAIYEELYYNELNCNGGLDCIQTYSITGTGDDQVLTLTNTDGNSLVFGKQPPTTLLVSTWWLHHIDIPGNPIIDIPILENGPSITFSNQIDFNSFYMYPSGEGFGGCNDFYIKYNTSFNGGNNITIIDYGATLMDCGNYAIENSYLYDILFSETTNFFEFEIVDEGSTLILTDLLGAKLIFGDTSLSIDEYDESRYDISLLQNPVEDKLLLNIDNQLLSKTIEYSIYSIEGKQVKSSILNNDSINVEDIFSGVYFISFVGEDSSAKTLKFIKK
ncbi:META domain-containing protein [Winogradskyella poriferorum]|uniref:META domain-containing protein n=1 Tax=Winogradskyella poriferorum TaxID=307627 RepID=A0ABU7W7T2_9FLAO|tara:strand:+ start:2799 stop:3929 length:1131 start_codon:yes stop_codon:yes gene_type:complete